MSKRVKNLDEKLLSDNWGVLKEVTFDYQQRDKSWTRVKREVYDRGDGAAALLYNAAQQTVLLIKQFRLPTYINDASDGFTTEVCAGIQDENDPQHTILREIEEELGYHIESVQKVMTIFPSPGAVTEQIHLYLGAYDSAQKVSSGGGLVSENEDIEVVEYAFAKALKDLKNGQIQDAKTVILLQHLALSGIMDS